MSFPSRRGRERRQRACRRYRREIVKERARRLREHGAQALRKRLDAEIGATRRVLTESHGTGRTEQFIQVKLAGPFEPGQILDLTIAGHDGRQLLAA
jgi:threonylcarbamoyladenosine tRNA methylthiotransferase MtaB